MRIQLTFATLSKNLNSKDSGLFPIVGLILKTTSSELSDYILTRTLQKVFMKISSFMFLLKDYLVKFLTGSKGMLIELS